MNIIVITGASSGMGRECALQLDKIYNEYIDEIWLVARRKDKLAELSNQLKHKSFIFDYDLTNQTDLIKFQTELELLNVNIVMLINAAGTGLYGKFEDLSLKEIDSMISLNCKGLVDFTYICLPYLNKNSRILQFASGAGFLPQHNFSIYAASKSFVINFSKALNKELKTKKVSVTIVCPGPVKTEFLDNATKNHPLPAYKKGFIQETTAVVKKALYDSYRRKEISFSSLSIKLLYVVSKLVPDKLLSYFI